MTKIVHQNTVTAAKAEASTLARQFDYLDWEDQIYKVECVVGLLRAFSSKEALDALSESKDGHYGIALMAKQLADASEHMRWQLDAYLAERRMAKATAE